MTPDSYPPCRRVSSRQISLSSASDLLSTFLQSSTKHPHLHPDAQITPTGIEFSTNGGPKGGIVLHSLRRVVAGMRGEVLEPEPTPEPGDDEGNENRRKSKKGRKEGAEGSDTVARAEEEEWQNMSEYEREEGGIEVGEIGPRDTFVQAGGEPEVHVVGESEVEEVEIGQKRKKIKDERKKDKEARKKAKKERNKEFKREKEKKRSKRDSSE
ncbi:hypothetical protein K469DRAFT_708362 [Zopfia rhizophila CBS 207.26]|uniref:Uncharacterized protein n=1 Tax=Zopfia rhizophila CBS 207.26 TaxID=1314779 RepID=A0A6A6E5D3_9PEZI|nr:hypothetical protein K469DRAFT_708362 [Zopfia rhizophila CBS 207.26]